MSAGSSRWPDLSVSAKGGEQRREGRRIGVFEVERLWLEQRLCEGADLDAPVLDARLVAGLRRAGRAAHDGAVGEPEGAAVPRAGDAAVADSALLQRAAHVTAGAV